MATDYRFWIVQSIPTKGDFDHLHYSRYDNIQEARDEAKQLAAIHQGRAFAILEAVEAYQTEPVRIEKVQLENFAKEVAA